MPVSFPSSLWVPVSIQTVNDAAAVNFTNLGKIRELRLRFSNVVFSEDAGLNARVSTDNGANFLDTAGDYQVEVIIASNTSAGGYREPNSDVLSLCDFANGGGDPGWGEANFFNFNQPTRMGFTAFAGYFSSSGNLVFQDTAGTAEGTTARNALRVLPGSGTIDGTFILEGIVG